LGCCFLYDLSVAISTWQAVIVQIILMADMNGAICKVKITDFCANLQESILSAHPALLPPVTFKQDNQVGKFLIDGV